MLQRLWKRSITCEDPHALRDALERSIDLLGRWMIAFTAVVVIGLLIEWSQPTFSLFRVHDLGGLVVTIGVAGELFVEYIAHRKELTLRGANARIERTDKSLLKAADERIAMLEKETADARRETAKLQLQLQSVSAQARGRSLSDMFSRVLEGKPRGNVELWFVHGDHEARIFALQMWHGLQKAGWTAPPPVPIPEQHRVLSCIPHQDTWGDLTLFSNRLAIPPHRNDAASALSQAITFAVGGGFNTTWGGITCPVLTDNSFVIVVGQK